MFISVNYILMHMRYASTSIYGSFSRAVDSAKATHAVSYTHLDVYKRQIQYHVLNATMKFITPARSQDFFILVAPSRCV